MKKLLVIAALVCGSTLHAMDGEKEKPYHVGEKRKHNADSNNEPREEITYCLSTLLDKSVLENADINGQDQVGNTPLHYAIKKWHVPCIEKLLKKGADTTIKNNDGKTAFESASKPLLHFCAAYGLVKLLDLVLQEVDHNILEERDSDGYTPLHYAAKKGDAECIKLLLDYGANINAQITVAGDTPLFLSAENGHEECVDILLKAKANPYLFDVEFCGPLAISIIKENYGCLELLLKEGVNPNIAPKDVCQANHSIPLAIAVEKRIYDAVGLLLTYGADPNIVSIDDYHCFVTPLYIAVDNNDLKMVSLLLKHGAQIDQSIHPIDDDFIACDGLTPLHRAVDDENIELVQFLLHKGANPNSMSMVGTSLDVALQEDTIESVTLLLAAGASIDIMNPSDDEEERGNRSIFHASKECLKAVIESGVPISNNIIARCLKEGNLEKAKMIAELSYRVCRPSKRTVKNAKRSIVTNLGVFNETNEKLAENVSNNIKERSSTFSENVRHKILLAGAKTRRQVVQLFIDWLNRDEPLSKDLILLAKEPAIDYLTQYFFDQFIDVEHLIEKADFIDGKDPSSEELTEKNVKSLVKQWIQSGIEERINQIGTNNTFDLHSEEDSNSNN